MKNIKNSIIALTLCLSIVTVSSCKKDPEVKNPIEVPLPANQVKDASGNIYHTITIGTQVWMVENLRTTKFRNGDAISQNMSAAWGTLTVAAYCDYENLPKNGEDYGHLYNWYAVNDARKIAPTGWHVASDAEWITLCSTLGGVANAAQRLKEVGTAHWQTPNTGTDNVGFKALPAGVRTASNNYLGITANSYWWTATEITAVDALSRSINPGYESLSSNIIAKAFGLSIRCVKD